MLTDTRRMRRRFDVGRVLVENKHSTEIRA